ncbi:MAG: hypothetical protein GY793_03445, partial [Proteobacteria bacterium]|nr:hypothetical protein [Pseudomonadota bacterium]
EAKTVGKAGAQSSEGGENAAAKPPIPQEKPEELISRLNVQDLKDNSPIPKEKPEKIIEQTAYMHEKIYPHIKKNEGIKLHPYLDSKGYITTGAGKLINSKNEFLNQPWLKDGKPATKEEKEAAYDAMHQKRKEISVTHHQIKGTKKTNPFNKDASAYENTTNLRLPRDIPQNEAVAHLMDDVKNLRKKFPDFDCFPEPAKEALLDMEYNMRNKFAKKDVPKPWPELFKAVRNQDWKKVAAESKRGDVGDDRNNWTKQKFLHAFMVKNKDNIANFVERSSGNKKSILNKK